MATIVLTSPNLSVPHAKIHMVTARPRKAGSGYVAIAEQLDFPSARMDCRSAGNEVIVRDLTITHLSVLQDPFATRSRLLSEMRHADLWVG